MTDPKENEEVREELSTEELKDVSGGMKLRDYKRSVGVIVDPGNPGSTFGDGDGKHE